MPRERAAERIGIYWNGIMDIHGIHGIHGIHLSTRLYSVIVCIVHVLILDVIGRHSYRESENRISCIVPGCQHSVTCSSRHCAIQRYKIAICCAMRSVGKHFIYSIIKTNQFFNQLNQVYR